MKYIVTGAAGLIGSALIWKLNRMGIDDILAVDHLGTSEKWKNLRALSYADYMEKDVFWREPCRVMWSVFCTWEPVPPPRKKMRLI